MRFIHCFTALAALLGWSGALHAQTAEDEARARAELAEAIAEHGFASQEAFDASHAVAGTIYYQHRLEDTAAYLRQREQDYIDALGADSSLAARAASDYIAIQLERADQLEDAGRYADAEPLLQEAVTYYTRYRGADFVGTLKTTRRLGTNIAMQNRRPEAEALLRDVLVEMVLSLGEENIETLITMNDLGRTLTYQDRHEEAERYYRQAYDAAMATVGPDNPETLVFGQNLGASLLYQRRLVEAEPIARDIFYRRMRVLGLDNPVTIYSMSDLATILTEQGRIEEARELWTPMVSLAELALGTDHPDVGAIRSGYTAFLLRYGDGTGDALTEARAAADLLRRRRNAIGLDPRGSRSLANFSGEDSFYFQQLLQALRASGEAEDSTAAQREAAFEEAIVVMQEAMESPANMAVVQRAAQRAAARQGPELAALASERQALVDEWQELARRRNDMLGADDQQTLSALAALDQRQAGIDTQIAAIDARMREEFPAFFDLLRPQPLTRRDTEVLFDSGEEAALLILPTTTGTHVIALAGRQLDWHVSPLTAGQMSVVVRRLRWDVGASVETSAAEEAEWRAEGNGQGAYPFDRTDAYLLYQQLIEPVEWVLEGRRHVYTVAGGTLASLPLGMLVTEEPQGSDGNPADLRATSWLADRYALIQLPSLQSLDFLRRYGRDPLASADGFLGFGDPLLDGEAESRSGGRSARGLGGATRGLPVSAAYTLDGDGDPKVNVEALRALARLPGTARELAEMRTVMDAPAASVMTGAAATEANVKTAPLAGARVIAFATHGLLAGEVDGSSEPGLVFTPPAEASDLDDGLLTMSEISILQLNAEWVILSACNTAAGDGAGAPGLSGLVKAFFLAGAQSLLASHWPVRDDVAAELTVRTIAIARENPELSRAEALQRAMREIRNDPRADSETDTWAHPNAWAPFTLVGDGRTN